MVAQVGKQSFVIVWPLSRIRFFSTPWTAAHQAPLSMGFLRQEFWNGLPLPWICPPGNIPNPGMERTSPALAGRFFIAEWPGKPQGSKSSVPVSWLIGGWDDSGIWIHRVLGSNSSLAFYQLCNLEPVNWRSPPLPPFFICKIKTIILPPPPPTGWLGGSIQRLDECKISQIINCKNQNMPVAFPYFVYIWKLVYCLPW